MNFAWASRLALAASVVVSVFVQPTRADACGGCFHAATDVSTSFVTDHRMVLSIAKNQTVLWDQVKYTGDPAEFAWVLPVRTGTQVELARDEWISALDLATKVSVKGPDVSCGGGFSGGGGGGSGGGCASSSTSYDYASGPGTGSSSGGGTYDAGQGVQVVGQSVVGPYQSVIVRSDRGEAISLWLKDNGFVIPDAILPTLVAYTREGFDFLALKLRPGQGVRAMRPVRVVTPGASYALPLRMVAAGIGAKVGLNLFVVTEGRVEAKNFPNATIDATKLTWNPSAGGSNYRTLLESALAEGSGRTWVTESAVSPGDPQLDPIVAATSSYRNACRQLGTVLVPCDEPGPVDAGSSVDAGEVADGGEETSDASPTVDAGPAAPPRMCRKVACDDFTDDKLALDGMRAGSIWVTRLHAELSGENCSQADLQLQASAQTTVPSLLKTDTFSDPDFKPCGDTGTPAANGSTDSPADSGCTCRQSAPATLANVPWVAVFATAALGLMLRARRRERERLARIVRLTERNDPALPSLQRREPPAE